MAEYFKCGHNKGWGLRLRDSGKLHVYCFGCVVEKLNLPDNNAALDYQNSNIQQKEAKLQETKNDNLKKKKEGNN